MEEPAAQAQRLHEERIELMRRAKLSALRNHEDGSCRLDDLALTSIRAFLKNNPPLGRPLGTGEPQTKENP